MDLDQMVIDANKRIKTLVNKLTKKAHEETAQDFDAAAVRLGLTKKEWDDARFEAEMN